MPCMICQYFQPTEPAEHKADREAGRCQSNCGNRWNQHTAINHIKAHGKIDGWCRLHPAPLPVKHNHICGDISVVEHFHNPHWGVTKMTPNDNIFEWAVKALGEVLNGTWQEQRADQLDAENRKLRKQLKGSRKVSASRLERLQKKQDERPVEQQPFRPRLVAAE